MKPVVLRTARLELRPFESGDAMRFFAIQQDWEVTRMLRMAPFPPEPAQMAAFVDRAGAEWRAGTAYRFAIVERDEPIGCADVDDIESGCGVIGYWLRRASWGQGLASEAAAAVGDFAFKTLRLTRLRSGHAADNPASGKVLTKLGFAVVGEQSLWSRARGTTIRQILYQKERPLSPEPARRFPRSGMP